MTNNPLVEALEPFATFAANNVDEEGWAGLRCERERIVDWFGPSDFRRAALAVTALASSAPATGEREQIVAWLRTVDLPDIRAAAIDLAFCIERGDHRTQSGEMEGGEHG